MARRRPVVVEDDPAREVASLGRYRLRFSDEAWSIEKVNALSDDEVVRELARLDAEREEEGAGGAA